MLKQISSNTYNNRRSIPRYLYHLTSKKNYDSILKTGMLNAYQDTDTTTNLNGVFLFDLTNFLKRWCNIGFSFNSGNTPFSLAKALFLNTIIKDPNIVLLKIPTKNLPTDMLRCRVQDINPTISENPANNGEPATNQKHYTRKRKAIEYIFQGNIPLEKTSKVGELNFGIKVTKPQDTTLFNKIDVLDFLHKLFKNQPEEKAIELAKKSSYQFVNLLNF